MPSAYHITLSHPEAVLRAGKVDTQSRFTNKGSDDIMALHVLHTEIREKFTAEELDFCQGGHYIDYFLSVADLNTESLLGFHMAEFWMHYRLSCTLDWGRWYMQVDRSPNGCWRLHVVLADVDKTEVDAERFVETLWRAYKDYFSRSWLPQGVTKATAYDVTRLYGDRQFEESRVRLICQNPEDFDNLIEGRLGKLPALGDVYRTHLQHGECMLWCDTNDPRYKAPASRLWLPDKTNIKYDGDDIV